MKFQREVTTLHDRLEAHGIATSNEEVERRLAVLRNNRTEAAGDLDNYILGWLDAESR